MNNIQRLVAPEESTLEIASDAGDVDAPNNGDAVVKINDIPAASDFDHAIW